MQNKFDLETIHYFDQFDLQLFSVIAHSSIALF